MRTFKQAQFDVVLRAKAQFEFRDLQVQVTPPGAMTLFSHETDLPSIFSGLEREQIAVNEAQTTVDLGELKRWAVDSNKSYSATRFFNDGRQDRHDAPGPAREGLPGTHWLPHPHLG